MPLQLQTVRELSEDAHRLVERGTPEQRQTVIAYLDAGRSVGPTCKALSVHRATLHYRLERIRELLGPEALDDGWRAISLHVALKLHHALTQAGAGL
jgi:DNA-binding PucR family transcriptional regulator